MVKAMDFRSDGCFACRLDSRHGRFFSDFNFFMVIVERRAAAQASAKQEHQRAGMSAANVGASSVYISIICGL